MALRRRAEETLPSPRVGGGSEVQGCRHRSDLPEDGLQRDSAGQHLALTHDGRKHAAQRPAAERAVKVGVLQVERGRGAAVAPRERAQRLKAACDGGSKALLAADARGYKLVDGGADLVAAVRAAELLDCTRGQVGRAGRSRRRQAARAEQRTAAEGADKSNDVDRYREDERAGLEGKLGRQAE